MRANGDEEVIESFSKGLWMLDRTTELTESDKAELKELLKKWKKEYLKE